MKSNTLEFRETGSYEGGVAGNEKDYYGIRLHMIDKLSPVEVWIKLVQECYDEGNVSGFFCVYDEGIYFTRSKSEDLDILRQNSREFNLEGVVTQLAAELAECDTTVGKFLSKLLLDALPKPSIPLPAQEFYVLVGTDAVNMTRYVDVSERGAFLSIIPKIIAFKGNDTYCMLTRYQAKANANVTNIRWQRCELRPLVD